MVKLAQEEQMRNKEAVIGALSSFLRGRNFEGKQKFITDMNGLGFI